MLRLTQLTKNFGAFTALDNFDFEVASGEIVALLGENGAGKSTTIGLIGGQLAATRGEIHFDGVARAFKSPREAAAAGIGIVHQHFMLVPSFTLAENLALHAPADGALYRARDWEAKAAQWAAALGWQLEPGRRIDAMSVGEQQRVEILKALFGGPVQTKLLLLDEPTANLTPGETDELFATLRRLRDDGLALVFVSHKLREVMELCDRAVVLRRGQLAGRCAIAATNPGQLAAMMVGREAVATGAAAPDAASLGLPVEPAAPSQKPAPDAAVLLDIANLSGGMLQDTRLQVRAGEIVGLAGVDGNGQRDLFELLCGLKKPLLGKFAVTPVPSGPTEGATGSHDTGMAFVPPDRRAEGLILSFDVAENLALSEPFRARFRRPGRFDWRGARLRARELMQEFDVRAPDTTPGRGAERNAVGRLSGGNAQKVVLARALASNPQLVVAVDPTRGLDVGAASSVHRELRQAASRGAGVLLISTDLDEVLALSDRVGALFGGHILPASGLLPRGCSREDVGRLMGGES